MMKDVSKPVEFAAIKFGSNKTQHELETLRSRIQKAEVLVMEIKNEAPDEATAYRARKALKALRGEA